MQFIELIVTVIDYLKNPNYPLLVINCGPKYMLMMMTMTTTAIAHLY